MFVLILIYWYVAIFEVIIAVDEGRWPRLYDTAFWPVKLIVELIQRVIR
jgi:hypothetical protein